jgi:hypothetical protein
MVGPAIALADIERRLDEIGSPPVGREEPDD